MLLRYIEVELFFIKGDIKSILIVVVFIIVKVIRDRLM